MMTIDITLINKLGLHARASAKFVSTASRYQSQINVSNQHESVNGKSIMGVMKLAASVGSTLTLVIDGPDETAMASSLSALINNRFGEQE